MKNGLTAFFFENTKNLGRSDDAKRRKKEDGLTYKTGRANLKIDQRILFIIFPLDVMY